MDFAPLVVAAAMVTAGAALVKDLIGGQVRKVVTFVLVYLVAVGVTMAMRASDFADTIDIGGKKLAGVNTATVLLVAFALLSLAKVYYDSRKAVDNAQDSTETKLPIADPPPAA